MPRVGLEPMIPVFERAKTVHALDRAATVIGHVYYLLEMLKQCLNSNRVQWPPSAV
jgi:hypothetical protein